MFPPRYQIASEIHPCPLQALNDVTTGDTKRQSSDGSVWSCLVRSFFDLGNLGTISANWAKGYSSNKDDLFISIFDGRFCTVAGFPEMETVML